MWKNEDIYFLDVHVCLSYMHSCLAIHLNSGKAMLFFWAFLGFWLLNDGKSREIAMIVLIEKKSRKLEIYERQKCYGKDCVRRGKFRRIAWLGLVDYCLVGIWTSKFAGRED